MHLEVRSSNLSGPVEIPGSKSHTIRAVAIASLAKGRSVVRRPLASLDTDASIQAYGLMGANINSSDEKAWEIEGVAGQPTPAENVIDVGNSGTTLYTAMGSASCADGISVFTGDDQIRRRPAGPLIHALSSLGAKVESTRGNDACPIIARGPLSGGQTTLDGSKTSQYLTSLLINCPLATRDTVIDVHNLCEKPYIDMTLWWLAGQNIEVENEDYSCFIVRGGQSYSAFDCHVPADYSSATFFMCAGVLAGGTIELTGLDASDTQGDKAVIGMLQQMGADIRWHDDRLVVKPGDLSGCTLDLCDTPDALPALAVTACFAEGTTRLTNVAQARLKETDRIAVMCRELTKMGADIKELPDGLEIRKSSLYGAKVDGHLDHRVIMALSIAGMCCKDTTTIENAGALAVTFPNYMELMRSIGANIASVGE